VQGDLGFPCQHCEDKDFKLKSRKEKKEKRKKGRGEGKKKAQKIKQRPGPCEDLIKRSYLSPTHEEKRKKRGERKGGRGEKGEGPAPPNPTAIFFHILRGGKRRGKNKKEREWEREEISNPTSPTRQ